MGRFAIWDASSAAWCDVNINQRHAQLLRIAVELSTEGQPGQDFVARAASQQSLLRDNLAVILRACQPRVLNAYD